MRPLAAVLLGTVVACTGGGDAPRGVAGACSATRLERTVALSTLLGAEGVPANTWLTVAHPGRVLLDGPPGEDARRVRLTSPGALGATAKPEETAVVIAGAADDALGEVERGSTVVVVRPDHPSTPARVVASVRTDGSVVFLGECAEHALGAPFGRFVAARHAAGDRRSEGGLLFALATDATLLERLREIETGPRSGR